MKSGKIGLLLGVILLVGILGCSGGGGSSSGSSSSSADTPKPGSEFVGAWAMSSGGSVAFYLYVESNNTFVVADVPDKTRVHLYGTWSASNGTFKGPFTNPGVGNGDLVCTLSNGVMTMDFIEHWVTPDKHVPYTGKKL
jgi:hypothetical protein